MAQGFQPDSCSTTAHTSAGSRDWATAAFWASASRFGGMPIWKIENRKDKTDCGAVDAWASCGAAVLRPYTEGAKARVVVATRRGTTVTPSGVGCRDQRSG